MTKKGSSLNHSKAPEKPIRRVGRLPKNSKADGEAPMVRRSSSSEGKIEQISDSEVSVPGSGKAELFNPELLSAYEVQEVIALSLSADRKSIQYVVLFSGRKDHSLVRKMLCSRKDMRLIDERLTKRYRFKYLISYLEKHQDE